MSATLLKFDVPRSNQGSKTVIVQSGFKWPTKNDVELHYSYNLLRFPIFPSNRRWTPGHDLFTSITGDFGLYQLLILLQFSLSKFPVAFHQLAIVFLNPKISYTCGGTEKNTCPCSDPKFDDSIFESSIKTEWNLICETAWLASLNQTIFQLGVLLGSVLFGMAADHFGRKKPLLFAIVLKLVAGCAASFMPDYWSFTIMRMITGLAVGGSMVVSFVHIMELVGKQYRYIISAVYHMPFNAGLVLLGPIGYLWRDFRWFQLNISVSTAACLIYFCFVPETPRWLLSEKRKEHAINVLERMAKVNERPAEHIRDDVDAYLLEQAKHPHNMKKSTILDLFRTPNLRKKIIIISIVWFSCGYCFYGISQYVGELGGNVFLNISISGTMALIGNILSLPLMKLFGRRTIIIVFSYVCAGALLVLSVLENEVAQVVIAVIGVCSSFITYGIAYLYCSELFPTVVRNAAVGLSSMMARAGSMFAPFVVDLQNIAHWLPPVIFAIAPIIAGTLTFFIPETKGHELTTTIEEGEQFGKREPRVGNK